MQGLMFDKNLSKMVFHAFIMLTYFFPLIGGIVADTFLGKFRTILYVSFVYAAGNFILAGGAALPDLQLVIIFSLLGLFLISLGSGGIKPCVSAFGGDQIILPAQEKLMKTFFSLFYFSINAGSTISTILTPILANDVSCFGRDTCYPLAFAVPGMLMVMAIIFFYAGKSRYIYKQPDPNGKNIVDVFRCVWDASVNHFKSSQNPKPKSYIDFASEQKYPAGFRTEVKTLLRILMIFIPIPMFWALNDQQGSSWTFQAAEMNRKLFWNVELHPEHMQVANPLLICALIPILEIFIYPLCAKFNFLTKPLERMIAGAILTAMSFTASSAIFLCLQSGYKLHVFWLLPQYVLVTVGEILISVTGLEFSYKEAPESMKSIIQAVWLLSSSLGNLFVVIISKFNHFDNETQESVFYSFLMIIDIVIFMYLAHVYTNFKKSLKNDDNDLNETYNMEMAEKKTEF